MFITTCGLVIRPFEEKDITSFVEAVRESLSTVGAWMPWCVAGYSADDARSWFDLCAWNLQIGGACEVGIFCADSGMLLGGIAINQINREHNFGNIGYWVRQSQQKRDVASRAVSAIAQFGFTDIKLTRLEIVAVEDNVPSRRVAEKVGATFECVARNRLWLFGKPHNAAVYSLIP